jgi:heme A synthase
MFVRMWRTMVGFISKNWRFLCVFLVLLLFVIVAQRYGIDKEITVFVVLFLGYVTQLFSALVGFIAAIPVIGPPIASLLSLPFIFIVNAIAYIVTFFSLRRGYAKEVLGSRFLVTAFLVGIVVGYALGKVL